MLPWQPNKMATGHITNKMGRQSSDDHNCQIRFTSLQWLRRIKQFSHYKSMGAFSGHGNQTKSQITIILAIFKSPYQNSSLTKLGTNRINVFGGVVI